MEKSKLVLKYKKDGRLSNATLLLKKKMIEHMKAINEINFSFQNREITLEAGENNIIEKFEKIDGKVVKFVKKLKIQKDRKINIPLGILSELGINPQKDNYIRIDFSEDKKLFLTLAEIKEKIKKNKIEKTE